MKRVSLVAQLVKNPPAMQETWIRSLGWEDPLEKGKATHSSILACRFHGLYSPWGCKELDTTERLSLAMKSFSETFITKNTRPAEKYFLKKSFDDFWPPTPKSLSLILTTWMDEKLCISYKFLGSFGLLWQKCHKQFLTALQTGKCRMKTLMNLVSSEDPSQIVDGHLHAVTSHGGKVVELSFLFIL